MTKTTTADPKATGDLVTHVGGWYCPIHGYAPCPVKIPVEYDPDPLPDFAVYSAVIGAVIDTIAWMTNEEVSY